MNANADIIPGKLDSFKVVNVFNIISCRNCESLPAKEKVKSNMRNYPTFVQKTDYEFT